MLDLLDNGQPEGQSPENSREFPEESGPGAWLSPAILCISSPCVRGTGMLHTALCTSWCVQSAPPRFVSVSCFHIPAFYWILKVMRNFLAFLHPTKRSWLCSKELQTRSCCPAFHLLSCSAQSLAGDKHCVVPAESGSCSEHPCPWSRSKEQTAAPAPEHCSPRERFLGETLAKRRQLCGVTITCHNFIWWWTKTHNKGPAASWWYFYVLIIDYPFIILKLGWGGVNFFGKYLHYVMTRSTMICKQWCSRDYLQSGVTSPCPQTTDPQFRLSQHCAVPCFCSSGVGITPRDNPATSLPSQTSWGFNEI